MEPTILSRNIRALRTHLGDKQASFAERVGVQQSYVSKWENKGMQPETRALARLASLAGVSVERFIDEPWVAPEVEDEPEIPLARDASASDPTVALDSLDLSYSMGPGTELQSYIESEPIRFDPVFLRRLTRAEWSRLKLARGVGDSMQPTLFPGDVVMIDTTQTNLNMQDRIYALAINGAAAIKRIRLERDRRIMIVSDNPDVDNYHVEQDELVVHGRVIWFGREL